MWPLTLLIGIQVIETLALRRYESNEDILPGRRENHVEPQMDVRSDGVQFAFGTARRPADENHYVEMEANGEKFKVPKGIYHYSNHDAGLDGAWTLPQQGQWWTGRAEVKDNYRNIDGVYLRHPLMHPINVQVITEKRFEHGLDGRASDQTASAAFLEARKICGADEGNSCEEALNRYYEIRAKEISERNAPLHEQLLQLGDIASSAQVRSRTGNGLGVLFDIPGQNDPLYVGAALDNKRDERIRVLFQPPR